MTKEEWAAEFIAEFMADDDQLRERIVALYRRHVKGDPIDENP